MLYRDLDEFLGDADSRRWKYANTFFERFHTGSIGVKLYDTYILIYEDDGTLTLNMGDWKTVTTKKRINEILDDEGWHLYVEKGVWMIWNWHTKEEYKFINGMMLIPDSDGGYERATVVNP